MVQFLLPSDFDKEQKVDGRVQPSDTSLGCGVKS